MRMRLYALFLGVFFCWTPVAQAETISLKLSDGNTVLGDLDLVSSKSLRGADIVLLVHGTLAHKDMGFITTQRQLLEDRDFNVLAITLSLGLDQRKGMYDCALPHNHRHQDAVSEINAWLDWLKGRGVSSVTLIGHSRGGNQVAIYIAEHKNPLVKQAVLVAPQTWDEVREKKGYETRYKKELAPILEKMTYLVNEGKGASLHEGIDFIYCPKATVSANSFVGYYTPDQRLDTPSLLKAIDLPILVVAGSKDKVVPDLADEMAKVDQENITFTTIEDADHMFLDFAGEDLADQVAKFIQGQ